MTDLKDRLARLLDNEPEAPYDIEHVVRCGRRARRRRHAALTVAGTAGAPSLTAAVVVPVLAAGGGNGGSASLGVQPSATPTPSAAAHTAKCYIIAAPRSTAKQSIAKLIRSG